MTRNHRRLLDAARLIVACWDRSVSIADLYQQIGAHIEDIRMLVQEEERKVNAGTKRRAVISQLIALPTAKERFEAGQALIQAYREKQ